MAVLDSSSQISVISDQVSVYSPEGQERRTWEIENWEWGLGNRE
jgi:hypothetical protein